MDEITIAGLFTSAGEVMTGFMGMTTSFITGLWANPLGKMSIGLTLVSGAIGLSYKLFLRRKHI